jgi:Transposase domain (DUF772)
MMGFQETPARLFYDFCLDEHVPADHLLRGIDRHLDLADLRQSLKPFYSPIGRPSVDPELMIRMLIVGYSMGIRSERRLCEEVHLNLAHRWFCRLGLDELSRSCSKKVLLAPPKDSASDCSAAPHRAGDRIASWQASRARSVRADRSMAATPRRPGG